MAIKKKAAEEPMIIPQLNIKTMTIKLVGDSPLIMHNFSEKAKKQIEDKQGKVAKQPKGARNPQEEFEAAMHLTKDGKPCFPVIAFKAAAVAACTQLDMTKVLARGAFHINGEFAEIQADEPIFRTDTVKIGMGTTDLRYRPEYRNWSTELTIRYNANVLSPEQIANLFNTAGFAVGIGEWRPARDGSFGMFHVEV